MSKKAQAQAGDMARLEIAFDKPHLMGALFGEFDRNLVTIENRLGVYISARGAKVAGSGSGRASASAARASAAATRPVSPSIRPSTARRSGGAGMAARRCSMPDRSGAGRRSRAATRCSSGATSAGRRASR